MNDALERELAQLEARSRRRHLAQGELGVDFASNDYLGLARHPQVVEAARRALEDEGLGGRASRLLGGGGQQDAALEAEVADWAGSEAALLFPSGWHANQGLLQALCGPGDAIFSDALAHASLIDGARLSRAQVRVFAHGDLEQLDAQLARATGVRRRIVVVEGVYSMDGDRAPLASLDELCARRDAWLIVDEAHAAGLLGPRGAGAWAELGRERDDPGRLLARTFTAGKALGGTGALVCGSRALRETLINKARALLFTTGSSPAVAAGLRAALRVLCDEPERAARVRELAQRLANGLELNAPEAAIVPWVAGADSVALEAQDQLQEAGYDVRAVRPPTVPEGGARLRLVCHAHNTEAEVDQLIRTLGPEPRAERERIEVVSPPRARVIFVTGTDTDAGKTVASAVIVSALRTLGPVRYWKPAQTGDDCDTTEVARLSGASPDELCEPCYHFPLPASPHEAAADAGAEIDPARLPARLEELRREHAGATIVAELAGGLLVPYTFERTQLDWLAEERAECVLVGRSGLGTLNHTSLSLEALRARHLEPRLLLLVGEPHTSNRATLERMGRPRALLEIPRLDLSRPLEPRHDIADALRPDR